MLGEHEVQRCERKAQGKLLESPLDFNSLVADAGSPLEGPVSPSPLEQLSQLHLTTTRKPWTSNVAAAKKALKHVPDYLKPENHTWRALEKYDDWAFHGGDLDGFTGLDLYKAPLPAIDDAAGWERLRESYYDDIWRIEEGSQGHFSFDYSDADRHPMECVLQMLRFAGIGGGRILYLPAEPQVRHAAWLLWQASDDLTVEEAFKKASPPPTSEVLKAIISAANAAAKARADAPIGGITYGDGILHYEDGTYDYADGTWIDDTSDQHAYDFLAEAKRRVANPSLRRDADTYDYTFGRLDAHDDDDIDDVNEYFDDSDDLADFGDHEDFDGLDCD